MVREKIKEEHIMIEHVSIEVMVANPLTKRLAFKLFNERVLRMGVLSFFDVFG